METIMRYQPEPAQNGFTLLELALIVVLICIIAAIAVPGLASSIRAAREGRAIANVKMLSDTQNLFYNDLGRYAIIGELYSRNYLSVDQFIRNDHEGNGSKAEGASESLTDGTYYYSFRYSTDSQGYTLDADPMREKAILHRRFRYRINRAGGKDSGGMGILLVAMPGDEQPPSSAYRPLN
jgi:type II secretory pathway pseudopilin PulG